LQSVGHCWLQMYELNVFGIAHFETPLRENYIDVLATGY